MGTYYCAVNDSKRELLHPHDLGLGAKEFEVIHLPFAGYLTALMLTRWFEDRVCLLADDFGEGYDSRGRDTYHRLTAAEVNNCVERVARSGDSLPLAIGEDDEDEDE